MQRVVPHLWFDWEARVAVEWYISMMAQSRLNDLSVLSDTPSGEVDILDFDLMGVNFQAINAGPYFKFNGSAAVVVNCASMDMLDELSRRLLERGRVVKPFNPVSNDVWVVDEYGLQWVLIHDRQLPYRLMLGLVFGKRQVGQLTKAFEFYQTVFKEHQVIVEPNGLKGLINLGGLNIMMIEDGAVEDDFNEAVSLMVMCEDQREVDYYWELLSADPLAEQCGWLKDRYGVSWQIVPQQFSQFMQGDPQAVERVTTAFLAMKKFDIKALEAAYYGHLKGESNEND